MDTDSEQTDTDTIFSNYPGYTDIRDGYLESRFLREIAILMAQCEKSVIFYYSDFGGSINSKTAFFGNFRGPEVVRLVNFSLPKVQTFIRLKIQSL